MIELFKVTSGKYEEGLCSFVSLRAQEAERHGNRFHGKTIFPTHSHSNIRKFAFRNRNVATWNSLPAAVVDAPSVDSFKKRLDSHWKHQPLLYDYKEDIQTPCHSPTTTGPPLSKQKEWKPQIPQEA